MWFVNLLRGKFFSLELEGKRALGSIEINLKWCQGREVLAVGLVDIAMN